MLTSRSASPGHSFYCTLLIRLGALATPVWSAPAADADAVLSALPLPPDIDPPTEASLKRGDALRKLALGKPVADGDLRSGFGIRRHPILRSSKMHTGVDWAARLGASILSAGDGTVIRAEWAAGYGRRVEIQHADGVVTTYSHMSRFGTDIEAGTQVRQGQVLGFVGSTGLSTGPHLHYEVLVNGDFVDPMDIYALGGMRVAAKVQKKVPPQASRPSVLLRSRLRHSWASKALKPTPRQLRFQSPLQNWSQQWRSPPLRRLRLLRPNLVSRARGGLSMTGG